MKKIWQIVSYLFNQFKINSKHKNIHEKNDSYTTCIKYHLQFHSCVTIKIDKQAFIMEVEIGILERNPSEGKIHSVDEFMLKLHKEK